MEKQATNTSQVHIDDMSKVDLIRQFLLIVAQGQKGGAFDTVQQASRIGRACKHFVEKSYTCDDIKDQSEAFNIIVHGLDTCQRKGMFTFDDVIKVDEMLKKMVVLSNTEHVPIKNEQKEQINTNDTSGGNIEELLQ
jgi:hypothetical protein